MTQPSPAALWTGRVLTGLFALFMLGASIAPKLLNLPVAHDTMAQLGWPPGYVLMIGLIELTCVVLYLIPRHVCPTVNNFDTALLVRKGEIQSVEKVSARGREMPLLQQQEVSNRR